MAKVFPNTDQPPLLSVDLNNGEKLTFGSITEVQEWLEQEKSNWNWLLQIRGGALGQRVEDWRLQFARAFQQMSEQLQQWTREPENESRKNAFRNVMANSYSGKSRIVTSSDPLAAICQKIVESSGPTAGLAALAYLLNVPIEAMNGGGVVGIVEAILIRDGLDKRTPDIIAEYIKVLDERNEIHLAQQLDELAGKKKAANEFLESSKTKFDSRVSDHTNQWNELIARINSESSSAIDAIHTTDAAFTKQMQLQASVDYWTKQSRSQGDHSSRYLLVLVLFAIVALALGGFLAWRFVPLLLIHDIGKQPEAYAVALVLTVMFSTVIFWAARVMVRLYLSAHHLMIDAQERVVMIQTYLALVKEDKLAPEERALVLSPLFHPSSDGIVKDEGVPDLSAAALFSRLLAKN